MELYALTLICLSACIFLGFNKLFWYPLILSVFMFTFPNMLAPSAYMNDRMSLFALGSLSARAGFFVLLLMNGKKFKTEWLSYICLLNSIIIIFKFFDDQLVWGLGLATTFDGVLMALLYPMALKHKKDNVIHLATVFLTPFAIMICDGSTGLGCLLMALAIIYFKPKYIWALLTLSPLALYYLFHHTTRFAYWEAAMKFLFNSPVKNWFFGMGPGSYFVLNPIIRDIYLMGHNELYLELHNDWLQILFEFGIFGLVNALVILFFLVKKYKNDRIMLATVLTIAVAMVFYYPLHNPVTALLIAVLI